MNELPFKLVGMTYDELLHEIENLDADPIPSDSESIMDVSEDEYEITERTNADLNIADTDSDSDDEPLAVLQARLRVLSSTRDWSTSTSPKSPEDFVADSGITNIVKDLESPTPGKLFQLFFDDDLLDLIVFETNLYSQQTSIKPKTTNRTEIKTFLGINLLMGLKKSPSYRDYWSCSPEFRDSYISSLMPVKRFSLLLSNIHLNDNAIMPKKGEAGYDKLYKLRPLLTALSQNFERCINPTREVSIDESMIKYKGRSSLKQYLPKKPIKRGYKDPTGFTEVERKNKNGVIEKVPCPIALIDYNQNMNFVDKFDQNLNVYKIDRKAKKWWHRIFFYFLDAALVNSFVLYKELNMPKLSMKDFRREVINFLVAETIVAKKRQSSSSTGVAIKKQKPYVPVEVRITESAHQPKKDTRRRCARCSTSKKQYEHGTVSSHITCNSTFYRKALVYCAIGNERLAKIVL
ncbi:unnamed protein product [Acanthoscelides obtectus]|uniref:PiggyBac transposable element-derived protein domain-containing protein n=1 Tax=Acanthoscelides obtectus TaxID=200917 RepID=A0A9P0LM73_ACAOB|nr:unnamed protein product [Acanthoscelides obtectus]CAK1632982.1 PiggyBac transposable element-derived protein 3 [Acanthoscelides obtectus]